MKRRDSNSEDPLQSPFEERTGHAGNTSEITELQDDHVNLVPRVSSSAGVLSVVATPIGNLRDITIRALEILKDADLIVCEDTRTSRIFLQRWGISTELMSLHRFSESRKTYAVLDRLARGLHVALISDAGVPAISDPGHRVVKAARENGFQVIPIPGPSSITALLSISGMDCSAFVYLGFAPRKASQRITFFQNILHEARTCIFFDTPPRIAATLESAAGILGSRSLVLGRELTKMHEEIISGTSAEIFAKLKSRGTVKGEIVIAVEGSRETLPEIDSESAVKMLMEEGLTGKQLADEARLRFGISKRDAYERFLELRRKEKPNDHQ